MLVDVQLLFIFWSSAARNKIMGGAKYLYSVRVAVGGSDRVMQRWTSRVAVVESTLPRDEE